MNRLESFHENRSELQEFLGSILEGVISEDHLKGGPEIFRKVLNPLVNHFPFLDLCYVLDPDGRQIGPNITGKQCRLPLDQEGDGEDRSRRPYYIQAKDAQGSVLTPPYFSFASKSLCVTVASPIRNKENRLLGVIVADIDFDEMVSLLEDDRRRRSMEPFFKIVYTIFSAGLLAVSLGLSIQAIHSLSQVLGHLEKIADTTPSFQATILLTLALAIFDLSKTIFEEEVLLKKDIRRHSATRRTLTRFIASILIAISIEALMLVFKFAIQDPTHLNEAGWLVFAVVGLLVGLGVYVYLGARAEILLINGKVREKRFSGNSPIVSRDRVKPSSHSPEKITILNPR